MSLEKCEGGREERRERGEVEKRENEKEERRDNLSLSKGRSESPLRGKLGRGAGDLSPSGSDSCGYFHDPSV